MRYKAHLNQVGRVRNDEFRRDEYIRLDKNEGAFDLPEDIMTGIRDKIDSNFLSCYPQVYLFKQALSKFLGRNDSELYVCSGADAAIKAAYEIFVCEGDQVVMPEPTYAMYKVYADLFRAEVKFIDYCDDLRLPLRDFIGAIGKKTKIVFLANPDSPTGSLVSKKELKSIAQECKKQGCLFLIDEAYSYFFSENAEDLLEEFDNLVIIRSFSKAMGLAALRLGYVLAHPKIIRLYEKVRPLYEINAFAAFLGAEVLKDHRWLDSNLKQFNEAKSYILNEFDSLNLKYLPVQSNFVHVKIGPNADLVDFMKQNRILIRKSPPLAALKGFVRISITKKQDMELFINLLRKYLAGQR